MSGLPDYLKELGTRQKALQHCIAGLGSALSRLEQVGRLEEVAGRVRQWQAGFVVDWRGSFPLRPARAWAIVGPSGIPDEVEVVGEGMSLFGGFGELCQPDMDAYRRQGKVVLTGTQFLELVTWLREEIIAGRLACPYQLPREGMARRPASPSALSLSRPEQAPGK